MKLNNILRSEAPLRQRGFSMIEILVTMVIVTVGVLGLAALQAKSQTLELESYQRAQALILLQDMERRIRSSRARIDEFTAIADAGTIYGTGKTSCAAGTDAENEACEWHLALLGAAETLGSGQVGAMIGARGCISTTPPTAGQLAEFFVTVVWQGMSPTADPPANSAGALCASTVDYGARMRRAVSTRIVIPQLIDCSTVPAGMTKPSSCPDCGSIPAGMPLPGYCS